jgi:hypothetical protein
MGLKLRNAVTASILVIMVVVIVAFLFVNGNLSFNANINSNIVVGEGQIETVSVNSVEYRFTKDQTLLGIYPNDESHYLSDPEHYYRNAIRSPQQGETYAWLGINVKILEVHIDRYVISVTPNDAKPEENSDDPIEFMGASSVTITKIAFNEGTSETISVTLKNTGTNPVTIAQAKVNNVGVIIDNGSTLTYDVGASGSLTIDQNWVAGNPYKIDLYDSSGQVVGSYQAVAP